MIDTSFFDTLFASFLGLFSPWVAVIESALSLWNALLEAI